MRRWTVASKHTPGPWTATDDGYIEHSGGWSVAKAYGANPTCAANAALIAAAPDLLAACELAASSLDTYAKTGAFTAGQPSAWLLSTLCAAIAKAKG